MSRYLSRKMREDLPWNFGLRRRICLQSHDLTAWRDVPPIHQDAGSVTSISFLLEQTVIEVSYEPVEIASGGQLVFLRVQNPTPGIWGFQIYPRQISSGIFHIWLPISGFAWKIPAFEFQSGYNDCLPVKCRRSYHLCCL